MRTPKKTLSWQEKFITSLAKCGNVSVAVKTARIGRRTAYEHRASDKVFAAAWEEALECAGDLLEEEARRRAQDGVLKPVWHKGEEVGKVREYSDTLLIFLLKGAKPDKYKERRVIEGDPDKPVTIKILRGVSMNDLNGKLSDSGT